MKSSQSKLKDELLSCYDESFKEHIIEFGKRITSYSEQYDVLILMARKCVCLVEAMKAVGLVQLHGTTISHRALDFDLQWLQNKKVAIIDDALISGTTIYKTKKKLLSIGCQVDTFVLCVNENWKKAKLVRPIQPYLELTDEECASLCSDIVTSISIVPIPYLTDYPIYSNLQIKDVYFQRLSAGCYWDETNTSTNVQAKHNIFTKTFELSLDGREQFTAKVGNIIESAAILKIRLYARKISGTENTFSCTISPIFVFHKLSITQVEEAFEFLVQNAGEQGEQIDTWCSPNKTVENHQDTIKSKLRILQYLASQKLFDFWAKTLNDIGGFVKVDRKVNNSLKYLFPEPLIPVLVELSKHPLHDYVSPCILNSVSTQSLNHISSNNANSRTDSWSVQYELVKMFLQLYHEYEIPARKLIWKYGAKILDEPSEVSSIDPEKVAAYQRLLDRLDRGYSTEELKSALSHLDISDEIKAKSVSVFLDNMIDIGVAVPITCIDNGVIFRGFRHGEDVNFGDSERHAIYKMLSGYIASINHSKSDDSPTDDIIAGIEIEKLSVLTLKRMLEQCLFTRPALPNILGQSGTIGVRFSLHGAVVAEGCPNVYEAPSDSTIRAILCDQGVLEQTSKDHSSEHGRYKLKNFKIEKTAVRKGVLEEAAIIGATYGYLRGRARKRNVKDRLTQKQLTLLATISNTKDLVGALAAELKFVDKVFRRKVINFKAVMESGNPTPNFIKGLRNEKNNHLFIALHSAHFKYSSWSKNTVKKILEDIEQGLEESDDTGLRVNIWRKMWPLAFNQSPHKDLPFYSLIQKLAYTLYQVRYFYSAFELSVRQTLYNELKDDEKAITEIKDCYDGILKIDSTPHSSDDFKLVTELGLKKGNYTKNVGLASIRAIEQTLYGVEDLLLQSDSAATTYGEEEKTFSYSNALFILLNPKLTNLDEARNDLTIFISTQINEYLKKSKVTKHALIVKNSKEFGIDNGLLIAGYRQLELDFLSTIPRGCTQTIQDAEISFILISNLNENTNLYRLESTNRTFGKGFYERTLDIHNKFQREKFMNYKGELIVAVEKNADLKKVFSLPARNDLNKIYRHDSNEQLEIDNPNGLFPPLDSYKLKLNWSYTLNKGTVNDISIGIIAIVSDEVKAVNDFVKRFPGYKESQRLDHIPSRRFNLGNLPAKDGGYHKVVITRASKQGNESITNVFDDLVAGFNPTVVVLLGIGGGICKKLDFCDVVIGDSVLDYDKRSITENGDQHTFNALSPIEPWIKDLYQQFEEHYGETPAITSGLEESYKETFSISMSPIASGNAVIKDKDADVRNWINQTSRKSQVVETEAVGFVEKYEHLKQRSTLNLRGYLIVRGISDLADKDKDKKHRYEPTYNAVDTLSKITELASPNFIDEIPK